MGKSSRNKKKLSKNYKMKYDDEGPSLIVNHALTREELSREELKNDLWERILDGELELEEEEANEEMIREYKQSKKKKIPKAVAFLGSLPVPLLHTYWIPKGSENFVKEVGNRKWHTKIRVIDLYGAKFLILDMSVDHTILIIVGRSFLHTCGGIINTLKGTTSTFDGVCHQKFYVAEIQNKGEESDSDDEEEYYLKRDEIGRQFYGPNLISYFDHNDPMERALAIPDSINPFEKIYVWKKSSSVSGSVYVLLLHTDWIPKGSEDFVKEVGNRKWHTKIRVIDLYGNTFEQGFETRSTNRKKSNYHKLSDIMSPHWV
ncbi:hypothetical protein Tco_1027730 [Tanacetum coccineum]